MFARSVRTPCCNTNVRSCEEISRVLALCDRGLNDCEVSRRTGVPRTTVRGWRSGAAPARQLAAARSCPVCGHPAHAFERHCSAPYAYLLGLYLGDGCLSAHPRGVYKLRITLDARYEGILDECAAAMRAVVPSSRPGRVRSVGCFEVTSYSKQWHCLFPQHGPGRKHEREIVLVPWQRIVARTQPMALLRGLIHSDGSRHLNTVRSATGKSYAYPRYEFSNRSADIRRIFTDACDRLGIAWRVMNAYNISVARRDSIARLDAFVGPKR